MSASSSSSSDSPQSVALSTDVVLLHIFKYIGVKDLLDCRLVNQKWHAVASEALYSRDLYMNERKLFAVDEDESEFYEDAFGQKISWKTLRFVIERMTNNINFRFLGFNIQYGGLDQKNFQEFVKSCGKYVRRLQITGLMDYTTGLSQALACFTEIEHIGLGLVGLLDSSDARFLRLEDGREIRFRKLRSLELLDFHDYVGDRPFSGTKQLCEELIRASPELQSIQSFDVCLTQVALECGKLESAVTDLYFDVGELMGMQTVLKNLPYLELFSLNSPSLKSLSLDGVYSWLQLDYSSDFENDDIGNIEDKQLLFASLNRILVASKDSLKKLRMDYLEQPQKFTKLTSLELVNRAEFGDTAPYRIFPLEWDYPPRFYFPALKTVRLELGSLKGDSVKKFFGDSEDDTFPTVTTLDLECDFDDAGIQALGATFPNVKTLQVRRRSAQHCKAPCLTGLWSFSPTLEVLEIFNFAADSQNIYNKLETCITGFDPKICENLRRLPRMHCDPCYLNAFRTQPSILNLRGLQRLSIHFVWTDRDRKEVPELDCAGSPIPHWYAFALMPELKAHFLYDFKGKHADVITKVLEPYKPYVSILPHERMYRCYW